MDRLGDLSARRSALAAGVAPDSAAGGLDFRGGLDVRGDGTVGAGFAEASERLGWLKSDSHHERLRRLRDKYGYEQ